MKTDRIYSIHELAYLFGENHLKLNELCPLKDAYRQSKVEVQAGEEEVKLAAAFFAPYNTARLFILSRSFWHSEKTVLTGSSGSFMEMTEADGRLYFSACRKNAEAFYGDYLLSPGLPLKKCLSIKLSRDGLMMLLAYMDALKKARMKAKLAHAETPKGVGAAEMIAELQEATRFFDRRWLLPFVQSGAEARTVDLNLGIQNLKEAGIFEPSFEIAATSFGSELIEELSLMIEAMFISSLYYENNAPMRDDSMFIRGRESLWCIELCQTGKVLMRTLSAEETKEMLRALFEPGDEPPETALPKLCPTCGAELLAGAAFCMACGTRAGETGAAAQGEIRETPAAEATPVAVEPAAEIKEGAAPMAPMTLEAEQAEIAHAAAEQIPEAAAEAVKKAATAAGGKEGEKESGLQRCAVCGAAILPGAAFCMECGAPMAAPAGQAPEKEEEKGCPNCGAAILPGAAFCMECGAKIK